MNIIEVRNLGKKYKKYPVRWKRILEWVTQEKSRFHEELWVLRGLNFSISPEEAVGIIGQNGAGKSTLLKILTGTTKQTEGEYIVRGRVAALLELGMGFHPEFTGRQNAYMSGQILGIDNKELTRLMPEIEAFAEIGEYIDQPTRTYSSGMVVRLAFSVATVVRPDILIVDEALSVGDAYFQHKCFDRIRKFKEEGTTLLFVSHDPGAVKSLCDRAILLDKGLMVREGNPEEILDYYNAIIANQSADYQIKQTQGEGNKIITRSGDGTAKIVSVQILKNEKPVNCVQVGDSVQIVIQIDILKEIDNPTVGILFKDRLGNDVFGTNTYNLNYNIGHCYAGERKTLSFCMNVNFGIGNYSFSVAVIKYGSSHCGGNFDWWDHAALLQVVPGKEDPFIGVCYVPIKCEINTIPKGMLR